MPRTIKGKYVTEAAQVFQNGDDFWHAGQYDEAREAYEKAAVLYKNKDDTEGEAFALMRLGELEIRTYSASYKKRSCYYLKSGS